MAAHLSPNTLFDVAYFRNFFRSNLLPSEFDTPITAEQNRHQTRQGVLASVSHSTHGHNFKAGFEIARVSISELFGFAVTDEDAADEAGISEPAQDFTPDNPFLFTGPCFARYRSGVMGRMISPCIKNLNLSLGVAL